jgi:hypothetical protein
MKLKRFNEFEKVNEELDTETYLSAVDKLNRLGHRKRSNVLKKHAYSNKSSEDLLLPINFMNKEYLVSLNDINLYYDNGIEDHGDHSTETSDYIDIIIKNIDVDIHYFFEDDYSEGLFIYNGDDSGDYGLDDRKSANNLVKLLKIKFQDDINNVDRKEKKHFEKGLKNLTPNLFYKN